MTQQEFEERTGLKVTGDEFEKVNAIYMAAGDMDKDRFCADYRKHKDCEIIEVLFEKADGHFERHEVDARSYVAWKDGLFIFEDETLENIMERVKRWYNVDVEFGNEALKELRFSGDLERYKDFSIVLRMLEKVSRIEVEIEGRTVYIK